MATATWRGLTFVFLWYASIIWSVYYVYCPLILLLFINRRWFRKCTDIVLATWEMYPAALLEILMGCRIYISGDNINPDDNAIIIMNHRNRLDWFFLWAALLHGCKPPCHRSKFVLKSDVRNIPGIGWGLQLAGFLYIHRNWTKDQELLKRSLDYFRDLGNKYQILIFPEGTNLSESTKAKSNSFAEKNGMKPYNYVLHPRTTGFTFLVNHMRKNSQLDAVYDLTIGYPKTLPTSETDILLGKIPEEVHFHITRHDLSTLPKDEDDVKVWCEERWSEKEKTLEEFYAMKKENRAFSPDAKCEKPWNAMHFCLFVWTAFTFWTIYFSWTNTIAFYWAVFCTVGFILVSYFTDGVQQFEIDLFRRFDKPEIDQNRRDHLVQNNHRD